MTVTINAKGTSVPFFTIGKNGTTIYQGTTDPSGSYTVSNGDYWLNNTANSLNVRTAGAWAAPAIGSLKFPTSSGSNGQTLATDGNGNLSWSSAGTGTVTSASVVSANGFAGTVATATTTPAITLTTSVTGILNGNGTSVAAAIAGDFPTLNQNTTGTAALADNITGGLGGQILYQSAAATTARLANGTAGQILQSNGTTLAPSWVAAPSSSSMGVVIVSGTSQTATAGNQYVLTNVALTTVTLPASASEGDTVWVTVANGLSTNIIARNGLTIMGGTDDIVIDVPNATIQLRYVNSSWRFV